MIEEWQGPHMKPWLKAIALAVVGTFLFSQVTWAAGIQPVMPQKTQQTRYYHPNTSPKSLKDILQQFKDEIFSVFSVPEIYAAEPLGNEDYEVMPYGYSSTWKSAADMVVIADGSEETVSETVSLTPETVSNPENEPIEAQQPPQEPQQQEASEEPILEESNDITPATLPKRVKLADAGDGDDFLPLDGDEDTDEPNSAPTAVTTTNNNDNNTAILNENIDNNNDAQSAILYLTDEEIASL